MKFNMDQELIGFEGKPIQKSEDDKEPITLGTVLTMACVNASHEKYPTGPEKLKIYRLLQRVSDFNEVDLKSEDVVFLKELVAETYGVVVVGCVYDLLERIDDSEDEDESE